MMHPLFSVFYSAGRGNIYQVVSFEICCKLWATI